MAESPQPRNPLLPSPISRMPRELLDEVFGHLELSTSGTLSIKTTLKAEKKLRKLGTNVSLVCKAWHLAGRRVAWSQVTCLWDGGRLVDFLLKDENKDIVKEIRKLTLVPLERMRSSTSAIHRRAAVDFVRLVEKCSMRLSVLKCRFPEEDPALWARLATSTASAGLRKLVIHTPLSNEDNLRSLTGALGKLSRLKELAVHPLMRWESRAANGPLEPAPVMARLPVKSLYLSSLGDETIRRTVATGPLLAPLLDPERLRFVVLEASEFEAANFSWIGAFRNLEGIFLHSHQSSEPPCPTLSCFIDIVSSLPVVKRVSFGSSPGEDSERGVDLEPSPISLGRLLGRLPPRIEYYSIGAGIYFNEDLGLSTVSGDREPTPDLSLVLNLKCKQDKKASPATICRRTQADGRQSWSRRGPARQVRPS